MARKARKVALINVADYPRERYSAYWEIRVLGSDEESYEWGARIYDRGTSKLLEESLDAAETRDAADTAAQSWVLERMKKYKRPENPQAGYALAGGPLWMLFELANAAFERWLLGPLFALAFSTTVRNERVQRIQVNIDLGAGAGLLRIYDGTRPATCGTATTLLAELTFSDPCAPAAASAVLTMSAITADASANATGTATWFRCVDSTGTCVLDGNVGTSGSDLNLNSTSISTGQQVSVTSFTITDGNA